MKNKYKCFSCGKKFDEPNRTRGLCQCPWCGCENISVDKKKEKNHLIQ